MIGPVGYLRLVDSPAVAIARPREKIVPLMAADLVKYDAFRNDADAFRSLLNCGTYSSLEIASYLPDARQMAAQHVVAREMTKP